MTLMPTKESMIEINETNRYAFGKVYVKIKQLVNMPNIGNLLIKVKVNPFQLVSRKVKIDQYRNYNFNQDFYIPIHNKFETITVKIFTVETDKWYKKTLKEQLIKKFKIPLPFLKQEPYNSHSFRLTFNENDVKILKTFDQNKNFDYTQYLTEANLPKLDIRAEEMNILYNYIAFNPNRSIIEN